MLALSSAVYYLPEMFNLNTGPLQNHLWGLEFEHWFEYIHTGNEGKYLSRFQELVQLRVPFWNALYRHKTPIQRMLVLKRWGGALASRWFRHPRVLLKDPIALMSAEWLHRQMGMDVVVLIRHPAAFAASVKRFGWDFDFHNLLEQEALMRDYLWPFENDMRRDNKDRIAQAVLLWRICYYMVNEFRRKWPNWLFVRHEDLSMDPQSQFGFLFSRLGLCYSENIRRQVLVYSDSSNPSESPADVAHQLKLNSRANIRSWERRLSQQEIRRIRDGTSDIYYRFYDDQDW